MDASQNTYKSQSPERFKQLEDLIREHPSGFTRALKTHCTDLLEWIDAALPEFMRYALVKEKCWWILNGITQAPICLNCGKQLDSKSFMSLTHGYRQHCCLRCTHESEIHSKHLSESYAENVQLDPEFSRRRSSRCKSTRMARNGGKYFSQESLQKRNSTIAADPEFWSKRDKKCKQTKTKHGHDPNWNNSAKAAKTRRQRNNGAWESDASLMHRRMSSQLKYGVDDPNKSDAVKQHKAEAFEKKYGPGITCWFQAPESRAYMKAVDEQRKRKEHETKSLRGTFSTSQPEERAWHMLRLLHPHLVRQFSCERYPFSCDFYDPKTDTFYECNFSWTHGGHWFDSSDPNDIERAELMRSKRSKYYDNTLETWTVRDVKKRAYATRNRLNYIAFWSEDEVRTYVIEQLEKLAS